MSASPDPGARTDRSVRWPRDPRVLSVLVVVGGLLTAELATRTGVVGTLVLAPPSRIAGELIAAVQRPRVRADIARTLARIIVAFVLATTVATALSLLFWRYRTLRRAYLPTLGALFGTPISLLYLVFVALLGRGDAAIVAISVPLGAIPMVITTTRALTSVDQQFIDVARNFAASKRQIVRRVVLPAAAPNVFAGLRLGLTFVVIEVLAVEFLLVINVGLGGLISDAYFRFRTTRMWVGICLVVMIVVTLITAVTRVERWVR